MSAKKKEDPQQPGPVVRFAPLGELKVYQVYEHELDTLASGSPSSIFLAFALVLLPISFTLILTLTTTSIESNRLFQSYLTGTIVTGVIGFILLICGGEDTGVQNHS